MVPDADNPSVVLQMLQAPLPDKPVIDADAKGPEFGPRDISD